MAEEARLNLRMQKELKLLLTDPPPSASFPSLTSSSSLSSIHAQIEGPEGTVYAKGLFNLKIQIPKRYPFQPPIVTFVTPIYHPNIDNGGRICLDILNLPPKGAWQPSLNISTVLTSIGLLLSEPNPDDGLMHDASMEYKYNRQAFDQKARSMTQKYARAGASDLGGRDQEIQTLTNARGHVEAKESYLPKFEVPDHFVNHKSLCGLSRKLSLDSAGRAQRHNAETVSEVPLDHILNKQMEVSKQAMEEPPIESNSNQDKVQKSTTKLSSEIVSPSKFRNDEKKDYMAKHQCSTSLEPQSIFLNYADIQTLPQAIRNSGKTANPNNNDLRNVSMNESTNKLLVKSTDFSQKNEDLGKLQFKPQFSAQLQSTASCHTLSLSKTPGNYNKQPDKNAADQNRNGFSTRHKKLGLTGRRHPSGTSSSSERQQKGDKENLAPSQDLPLSGSDACIDSASSLSFTSQIGDSCATSSNPCGTSKKLPLEAVEHFNSFQMTSQSGKHSTAQVNHPLSCEQPNQVEDEYYNRNIKQQEKESPKCEAVIVLDSEESEDERSLHKRSKLSLVRKHVSGKRKAQLWI
ncbi:uncharacterized protein [Nicotiana sylvestris]|uniref:E2 ubiquitin-conjugating enzyme n=2 Tax=Nicotiana TaxID=4085 RepID=A0A1S3YNC5_TOBAC|nr:PREDICTED: uncharacterized protein LOC104245556 isoform X1 [Nicotiana sylvestris]XP_016453598.1 PREDICTED: uncharacterized protein LOC107777942 isoform X1 [Nicotiana tabacum]